MTELPEELKDINLEQIVKDEMLAEIKEYLTRKTLITINQQFKIINKDATND